MAFRRKNLADMGGFDPVFRYYLDEADVNLRLAARRAVTVMEPRAEVLHCAAAGIYRTGNRAPRDLKEIGASRAAFLRHHDAEGATEARRAEARADHRRRLVGHMVAGRLMPGQIGALLAGWDRGWAEGTERTTRRLPAIAPAVEPFLRFESAQGQEPETMAVSWWRQRRALAQAKRAVRAGKQVYVWVFSFTGFRHRLLFELPGVWLVRGGVFGRSEDSDPVWHLWTRRGRLAKEFGRIGHFWTF